MFIEQLWTGLADSLGLFRPTYAAGQVMTWPELEKLLWRLINLERSAYLGPKYDLVWSDGLAEVARSHSGDMLTRNYFAHPSPEGQDVGHRLRERRIRHYLAGENIYCGHLLPSWREAEFAHRCFMSSQGHRQVLLDTRFTHVGIGLAGHVRKYMITEVFIGI